MKLKIRTYLTIGVSVVGGGTISTELLDRIKADLNSMVGTLGIQYTDVKYTSAGYNDIVIELLAPVENHIAIKKTVANQLAMLSEHGPHAGILKALLDKHPELKTHPKFSSVLGAFENLNGVLKTVLEDKSNRTVAEINRREVEGIELEPEDFESTKVLNKGMTKEERAQFREQSILGNTAEQRKLGSPSPEVPEIYKKLAAQNTTTPKEFGPPLPGDEGNVFTRPSKG